MEYENEYIELHDRPYLFPEAANIIYEEWHQEFATYYLLYTVEQIEDYIQTIPCFVSLINNEIQDITLIEEKDWIMDVDNSPWLSNVIVKTEKDIYLQFLNYVLSWYKYIFLDRTLYCWSFDQSITDFYTNIGFNINMKYTKYKEIDNVVILDY
jgi:hypothetical protein